MITFPANHTINSFSFSIAKIRANTSSFKSKRVIQPLYIIPPMKLHLFPLIINNSPSLLINTIDNPIPIYNETPAKIYTESSCKSRGEEWIEQPNFIGKFFRLSPVCPLNTQQSPVFVTATTSNWPSPLTSPITTFYSFIPNSSIQYMTDSTWENNRPDFITSWI